MTNIDVSNLGFMCPVSSIVVVIEEFRLFVNVNVNVNVTLHSHHQSILNLFSP